MRSVYGDAERGLQLLGAVAVEDKLQEDVTGTLVRLGMAGVKVEDETINRSLKFF